MTFATNNLWLSGSSIAGSTRTEPKRIDAKTFAADAAAPRLAHLSPLAYDTSVDKWVLWSAAAAVNEVQTITISATGGTFTVTYDGVSTGALAYNISAADLKTALAALPGLAAADLTVTLNTLVYTITFGGALAGSNVVALTTNAASLTGGSGTATVATGTAGVAANGQNAIAGFLYDKAGLLLDASNDVLGTVMVEGDIHYSDIPLPDGESAADLKAALRSGPRALGLHILGLENVR